jgi:uncharacterized protein (UPF0332 family)
MKKQDFLTKIKGEGKLDFIEPSEEISNSYVKKSESYLSSAKLLIENDKLEESISLTYYSMYYMSMALLFKVGIKSENHTATTIILREVFDLDNSELNKAKKERVDKQYYTDFNISKEDARQLITIANHFNSKIYDFIQKINNQKIKEYKAKLEKIT